ncbi:MAG: PIN domain-containing protein [Pirellulales bacterium]|nr:PIN domain-containing protein [Pirellulales bacterium]
MRRQALLDTGPLVAYLDGRDHHHAWTVERWTEISPPLLTCEAVIAEACHLLHPYPPGKAAVLDLLRRGVIQISFRLEDQIEAIALLLKKYANLPISLADACLVRMADVFSESSILTLDSHFHLYRRANRSRLRTIMPPRR